MSNEFFSSSSLQSNHVVIITTLNINETRDGIPNKFSMTICIKEDDEMHHVPQILVFIYPIVYMSGAQQRTTTNKNNKKIDKHLWIT